MQDLFIFLKSSYCSHDHNFTLQSLKLKQRAALRKIYIYQTQLQWRTPKNTKHVCLLMFSRCVIDYKHLLIQLWINRVTAEGALLSTLNRFCCRFSTWSTSVPCSCLLSRPSQGACHLSCGARMESHTSCTRCLQYMSSDAHKHTNIKKFLGTSTQWLKRSHTKTSKLMLTCTHCFLPLNSFILVTAT